MADRIERPWYRWYVLAVLVLVYSFSYVDRQIVTVLAPYLKADLHISDAQLGLLYGTTFALFYGVFGIPLARLADGWSRVRTLALGLSFWSLMTSFSGAANSFAALGTARIGVGVGEASSTPAAISLLGDYFERERRGTVLGLYSVGVYVGAGVSLMIGGSVVGFWQHQYPHSETAPFGLAGWQAAFMAVGIPGLLLALLILLTIREPVRGRLEKVTQADDPAPFKSALRELSAMIPPFNLIRMAREGQPRRELVKNASWIVTAIVFCTVVTLATNSVLSPARRAVLGQVAGVPVTSNLVQWMAMGIAFYAVASWFQSVRLRDPLASRLMTGSKTFRALTLAGAFLAFAMNSTTGFVFLYATRYLGFTAGDGLHLGVVAAISGGLGITASGYLSDLAYRLAPTGRLTFVCITASLFTLASIVEFTTTSTSLFYVCYAIATFFVPMWFAPNQATTQDLVVPRLRGTAFAMYSLGANIIGLGLGPYTVGLISDATGDLRLAILCALATLPLTVATLIYAARNLGADERAARVLLDA
ncbi:MFS transporter [Sphingomonas sp. TF3]|uniref:MFS transporter n=1 Tax=Sphingomonas sp. TF3 TaxID=2495580 RepID=UPI000F89571C|nr:MFS transporter [Sphingomonas sp. TF3]RUN76528.1 MFS transporter [Sphingomonas sp. TF3]